MSQSSIRAREDERRKEALAEREALEIARTKAVLDWIAVHQPKSGNVLVLTVPAEHFTYPGSDPESWTDEQKAWMQQGHATLRTLVEALNRSGTHIPAAAVLGEGMTLDDLPPPPQAPRPGEGTRRESGILLPPGTRT